MKTWQFSIKVCFVTRFACAILALKTSGAKVLNSWVSIYFGWLWLLSFFSIFVTLMLQPVFSTKLLILGILFSMAVNAVFVAKLLTSGLLLSISLILAS